MSPPGQALAASSGSGAAVGLSAAAVSAAAVAPTPTSNPSAPGGVPCRSAKAGTAKRKFLDRVGAYVKAETDEAIHLKAPYPFQSLDIPVEEPAAECNGALAGGPSLFYQHHCKVWDPWAWDPRPPETRT